jgi:hypothetical protein
MADLTVTVDGRELAADWTEDNPRTRAALDDALPVGGAATRWGDELYVDVPVDVPPEETRETVPVGALAYWPAGNALCLFWGPTPASTDDRPRAAAPVAVLARVADVSPLATVEGGAHLGVEPAE